MPITRARRASSLAVLVMLATGFAGGGGWVTGRASDRVSTGAAAAVEAPAVEDHDGHAGHARDGAPATDDTPAVEGHQGHHGPQAGPTRAAAGHESHGHDCKNGLCRCDSKCPPRRSGPCGGSMRSCSGTADDAGVGPGPVRPFLVSAAIRPQPYFDFTVRPDHTFLPLTRDLEPVSPPPRTSAV